jgi:hypothetical protein
MRALVVLSALLICGLFAPKAKAYQLLAGLSFNDGAAWEVIAVSLHNYAITPQQTAYKTFIVRDVPLFSQLQASWDFPLMFRDVCEYHYIIKVYRNKALVKSFKLNLLCNYITDGAFSYQFDPNQFELLAKKRLPVPWSRIWFKDIENLRKGLGKLAQDQRVYFYHDTRPYESDGYFLYGIKDIPIRADRDSLQRAVAEDVARAAGISAEVVYVVPHLFTLESDKTLFFRYKVYCASADAERFQKLYPQGVVTGWRSHHAFEPEIPIVVVGVNEKRYWEIVRQ